MGGGEGSRRVVPGTWYSLLYVVSSYVYLKSDVAGRFVNRRVNVL